MRSFRIFLITTFLIFLIPAAALAGGWKTLKTEHFTVFYSEGFETEAWQCLEILEYYRPEVEKISGNEAAHLSVVIDDTGTLVNGYSNPIANQCTYINIRLRGARLSWPRQKTGGPWWGSMSILIT